MMKMYQSPSICTVDSVCFETVCAASGISGVCPAGKSRPNPLDWWDSSCPSCLLANAAGYGSYKQAYAAAHPNDTTWEANAANAFLNENSGSCPAGFAYP